MPDLESFDLHTPRLLVRPYIPGDAVALSEAARESVDTVGAWLEWCHAGYQVPEAEEYIAGQIACWRERIEFSFAIFRRSDERFLGGCGINQVAAATGIANYGYWIRASEVRKGYCTEASRLVTRFAFEQLGLHRLEIAVAVGNTASREVAKRIGAVEEGIAKDRVAIRGVLHDAHVHALLPSDLSHGCPQP